MKWTHTLTGILIGCSVLDMLPLSWSFPDADFSSGSETVGPKIVQVIHKFTGKRYSITCKVLPGQLGDETLVYWLGNDQFLKDSRLTSKEKRFGGYIFNKLVFKEVLPIDCATNFTCIALNPAGFDRNDTTLCKCAQGSMTRGPGHLQT